jgi:hypothetical protein
MSAHLEAVNGHDIMISGHIIYIFLISVLFATLFLLPPAMDASAGMLVLILTKPFCYEYYTFTGLPVH